MVHDFLGKSLRIRDNRQEDTRPMTAPISNTSTPVMAASEASVASKMTSLEKRSSFSLASIYALRMLGLFVVLPVFALEAAKYPGGNDAGLVGLAMGIYGLTQGVLQMVFGAASDKLGRKKSSSLGC
jgi:hypothetical protein